MIGILKSNVHDTDNNLFMIESLNQLIRTSTSACLFCDHHSVNKASQIHTSIFPQVQVLYFNDILITDDLTQAQSLLNVPNARKRFIYLYHLEWAYIESLQWSHLESILLNDNIGLIARSERHAKLITDLFKKPQYIMPEWDYETLIRIDNDE